MPRTPEQEERLSGRQASAEAVLETGAPHRRQRFRGSGESLRLRVLAELEERIREVVTGEAKVTRAEKMTLLEQVLWANCLSSRASASTQAVGGLLAALKTRNELHVEDGEEDALEAPTGGVKLLPLRRADDGWNAVIQ